MADVFCMEMNQQVLVDLVMSVDGRIGGPLRTPKDKQPVKVFITNPDMLYSCKFDLPRIAGQLPLMLSANAILQAAYDTPLEYTMFGKPSTKTFEYAAEVV